MITHDQRRAAVAYAAAKEADAKGEMKQYKIAVNALGPNILRSGLVGAFAFLQRTTGHGAVRLAADLGPPLGAGAGKTPVELVEWSAALGRDDYQRLTRETLRLAHWLKRACQAYDSTTPSSQSAAAQPVGAAAPDVENGADR